MSKTRKQRNKLRKKAAKQRGELIERDGRLCCYCCVETSEDVAPAAPTRLTIEHVKPISKGGGSELGNLKIACYACNQARGNGDVKQPKAKPRPAPARSNVIDLSLALEDSQARREFRAARAAALGVTDRRFLPRGWSLKQERDLRLQIWTRCGPP